MYSLEILEEYVKNGWIVKQSHPTLPLSIWNYSRGCQYEKMWDTITLACRGLVLDNEGNVVAKPFPKFFNYEEHTPDEIPNESFEVFEKMDGSLGICFYYAGEWHMATRGSFVSEQAVKGRELLRKYNTDFGMIPGYTYLFEILFKTNRVVVDYGDYEGLVMLGAYDTKTGKEVSIAEMVNVGFDVVKRYDGISDYRQLKGMIDDNAEGFVIRFKNGMRMKIKGDEYVRLHRILSNFSSKDIWELLKDGGPLDEFLDRVPDEFDAWVKEQVSHMKYEFYRYSEHCGKIHDYFRYGKYNDREPEPTKKEFVEHLERCGINYVLKPILFAMWDKKPYDGIVWKLIKPKWSRPFKKDLDN